jgi:hypothetical protein
MIADLNERHTPTPEADNLEVAHGFAHENIEGWAPVLDSEAAVRDAMEKAFDYRGDVTITLKLGSKIEGYIFDRYAGPEFDQCIVRILAKGTNEKLVIPYENVAAIVFSGKDAAAGKSWEAWVNKYMEKKKAGETGIGLQATPIDE